LPVAPFEGADLLGAPAVDRHRIQLGAERQILLRPDMNKTL